MYERIKRARSDEAGFSLIELMIVVIVLGILSAVVVFAVGGFNNTSQVSACRTDARTVRTAQEANRAQFGAYATEADLVTNGFLAEMSSLHDTAPAAGGGYTITPVAPC